MGSFSPYNLAKTLMHPRKNLAGKVMSACSAFVNRGIIYGTVELLELKPNNVVLEIGFGPGLGLKYAAGFVAKGEGIIYGLDHSSFMVEKAEKRCRQQILSNKVKVFHGSVEHMPFENNLFDIVFHCHCFYFWPDLRKASAEIFRVLKPGGGMIGTGVDLNAKNNSHLPKDIFVNVDVTTFLNALKATGFLDVRLGHLNRKNLFGQPEPSVLATKPYENSKRAARCLGDSFGVQ